MIFMSDATHLTNFSGKKKAWPIYMTIGNLSATARMKHTMLRGSITEWSLRTCSSMCCNPYSSLKLAPSMPAVPMTTSGIVIRHWLHGWPITPSTVTFTTSRMVYATGANAPSRKWVIYPADMRDITSGIIICIVCSRIQIHL